jgi:two-component system nitrogen regulation response regulator NtrX
MDLLIQYDYSGNIRELENIIERAVILSEGKTILPDALPLELRYKKETEVPSFEGLRFAEAKEMFEKEYIISALTKTAGNIAKAAEAAGLDRNNFKAKMKKHGIEAKSFKK